MPANLGRTVGRMVSLCSAARRETDPARQVSREDDKIKWVKIFCLSYKQKYVRIAILGNFSGNSILR